MAVLGESSKRRVVRVFGQFVRFLIVGLISFAVDFGLYMLLLPWVHYILASTISFTLSLILNYVLTLKFVFVAQPGRSIRREFAFYVGLNIIALGLNQGILFLVVELLGASALVGKIVATAFVLVYNFVSRKLLIERLGRRGAADPQLPAPDPVRLSDRPAPTL